MPVPFTSGDWEDGDAVFSPVDNIVAFTRAVSDGDSDVYTRRLGDPSAAEVLVAGPTIDHDPTWSPDGTCLAFTRGPAIEGTRIYVLGLDPPAPPAELLPEPIDGQRLEMVPAWSRR